MSQHTAATDLLITTTEQFVKKELADAEGGHDWWHIYRVWKLARKIAAGEQVDMLVVELSALLHDIADSKFHGGDENIGPRKAREFLESIGAPEATIRHVVDIIVNISFKGGHNNGAFYSPELGVVQDADRLDAIGAIGIARTFNYGGFKNRAIYDPTIQPDLHMTKEQYKNSTAPTINHFYEKLLLLKDRMNTATGRQLAAERHVFMETFLEKFYQEWEGES
ncbi:HD domain-containing protein [Chitinophaga pinensis]|uniref:Metal dependent phosphohydrolase n=1 Tax=Chitinophaga pinensis (strain ATCC 43595 / DSM 2588 / LMG 13176 / NBRC 15968 / NCIMB 11800 / UQM 2034) TaxID=485918 RepID=A0A979GB23_CHIPD|nr:HD domain-containing protein [Chitinophaga pinensis]ACU64018.1 metal dependent phosphohydrolase [Chitinophaga pinensis DSM 2588]